MSDYKKVGMGIGVFALGYILTFILQYFIPPILGALGNVFNFPDLIGLGWFATILIMVLGMMIVPMLLIVQGINTESKDLSKGQIIVISVIWIIFALAITVKGWFMIPNLAGMLLNTWLQGLFYVSLLLVWIGGVFGTPISDIIKAYNKGY
jgi:hypothetical protein